MADRIMVVDDDLEALQGLQTALEGRGFEVTAISEGARAWEWLSQSLPDLLVLDAVMPDLNGIELLKRVRAMPEAAIMPIIMLSVRAEVQVKVLALQAGADEYLTKPISPTELEARIQALLGRTRHLLAARSAPEALPGRRAKVLGFVGSKGGVGTSTVAVNVATALATPEREVIAAELVPFGGNFAAQLGHSPALNLSSLLGAGGTEVEGALCRFPGDLRVLFGPQAPADFAELEPRATRDLVGRLASICDVLALDLGSTPSSALRALIPDLDYLALVLEPEMACVRSAQQWLSLLNLWGMSAGLVGAVMDNRAPSVASMSAPDAGDLLGCAVMGVVPQSAQLFGAALEAGQPVVQFQPMSGGADGLYEIATSLMNKLGFEGRVRPPMPTEM